MAHKQAPGSATIWAVLGSSGSGKGVWTKAQLRRLQPPRLLVWDYLSEYGEFVRPVTTLRGLAAAVVKAGEGGPLRYGYSARTGDLKTLKLEFASFCKIAWAAPGTTLVVEELSAVTTPSYAPPDWARLCNMGRHRRMHVIGVSQYPAQMDKSLLGNATLIHTGMLRNDRHRKAVAEELDVNPDLIRDLAPLEYLERDFATFPPTVRRGSVAGELAGKPGSEKRKPKNAATPTAATPTGKGAAPPSQR